MNRAPLALPGGRSRRSLVVPPLGLRFLSPPGPSWAARPPEGRATRSPEPRPRLAVHRARLGIRGPAGRRDALLLRGRNWNGVLRRHRRGRRPARGRPVSSAAATCRSGFVPGLPGRTRGSPREPETRSAGPSTSRVLPSGLARTVYRATSRQAAREPRLGAVRSTSGARENLGLQRPAGPLPTSARPLASPESPGRTRALPGA
jgi:hypothetical protein